MTALPTVLLLAALATQGAPQESGIRLGPYLQEPTPNAITVMWETDQPARGALRFGRPGQRARRVVEPEERTIHELRLTGLRADTEYEYAVEGADGPARRFRTAPKPGAPGARIAIYGDSRSNSEVHRRIAGVLRAQRPGLVVNTGDLVGDGRVYEQWKAQFFDPLADLAAEVPVVTVLGNHARNSHHYFDYFDLPGDERSWVLDWGNVRLVGFDSCSPHGPGTAQYEWLERELARAPRDRWLVVVFHHPLFSGHPTRGTNANRWTLQPLFQEHGVDLVFTGHDHHYQRCNPIGSLASGGADSVVHFTTGGGGAGLYPIVDKPWTAKGVRVHNGTVLDFGVDEVVVRAFSEDGELIDTHTIQRAQTATADELISYEAILFGEALGEVAARDGVVSLPEGAAEAVASIELALPSPFSEPMVADLEWTRTGPWSPVGEAVASVELRPSRGGSLPLQLRSERPWPDCYPLPELRLRLRHPDGTRAFRNDTFAFHPVLVRPERTVACPRVDEPRTIDGEPSDWDGIPEFGSFVIDDGLDRPGTETRVRVVEDPRGLCVLAFIDMSDDREFGRGEEARDHRYLLSRDESFAVHLACGDRIVTAAVNARGTQYDAVDGDRQAEQPAFESAVSKAATSWYCELRIPHGALPAPVRAVQMARVDGATEERSLLVPTFGPANDTARWARFERAEMR